MKTTLVNIIIFFLLGSNVVWAFDVGEQLQERELQTRYTNSGHVSSDVSSSKYGDDYNEKYSNTLHEGDHDNSNLSCDHCCHGNAHFLGVFSGQPDVLSFLTSGIVTFVAKNTATPNFQPPTPPPNV